MLLMLNPDSILALKPVIHLISVVLLIRLVPAIASTLIMALSRLFENQEE